MGSGLMNRMSLSKLDPETEVFSGPVLRDPLNLKIYELKGTFFNPYPPQWWERIETLQYIVLFKRKAQSSHWFKAILKFSQVLVYSLIKPSSCS